MKNGEKNRYMKKQNVAKSNGMATGHDKSNMRHNGGSRETQR